MEEVLITGEKIKSYLAKYLYSGIETIGNVEITDIMGESYPSYQGYDGIITFTVTAKYWLKKERNNAGFGLEF